MRSLGQHAKGQPALTPKVEPFICDPSANHFQRQGLYRFYLVEKACFYNSLICTKVAHELLFNFSTSEKSTNYQNE